MAEEKREDQIDLQNSPIAFLLPGHKLNDKEKKKIAVMIEVFTLLLILAMAYTIYKQKDIIRDPYGFCGEYCEDVCVSCDFTKTQPNCGQINLDYDKLNYSPKNNG